MPVTKRTKQPKKPRGTPPDVKERQIEAVLAMMHGGKPMVQACDLAGLASTTFVTWADADSALAERYARAREALIERMASDIIKIADEPVGSVMSGGMDGAAVQKQKLQVDARKWILSKVAPKKYGDKMALSGDVENPVAITTITRKIV